MQNLKAKINGHNKNILKKTSSLKTKICHCLKKENCLMKGACLIENVLYYAKIDL